ncbi:recombinase [Escherichia coli]|nr:recombinase [Escherichia coli]
MSIPKIFIDDGSTTIKMRWLDKTGEPQKHLSPNSFKRGFSTNFGGTKAANYTIGVEKYSFDPYNNETLKTREVRYQYGELNLLAIHHALHTSGIEPQTIDVVVSLPISEYFDADNQLNQANIDRKTENLRRSVEAQGREPFTIRKIDVLPESIPAGIEQLGQLPETFSMLIVDLGGTTLDIAQVTGQATSITRIQGVESLGVNIMTEAVRAAMVEADTPTSALMADLMIQNRDNDDFLREHLNNADKLPVLKKALADSQQALIQRVLDVVDTFKGFTHAMVIGGGAELIADALKAHVNLRDDRFYKTEHSQFDLVDGMLRISQ